ncbi:MAG: hypothetical protein ACE5EH_02265 [Gammaproteobacteria bacterium]
MGEVSSYQLVKDKKGILWDLVLYVPTVLLLLSFCFKQWYSGGQTLAYVLFFLASFIFFIGMNRILTRLLVLPSSPKSLEVSRQNVALNLNGGDKVDLAKDLRFHPDYAGKSFGLTGMDITGKKRQFVFHRGQFVSKADYKDLCSRLNIYK